MTDEPRRMFINGRSLLVAAAPPSTSLKESGLGREGGREGIEEYTEVKAVVVNLS